jgi:hypothetical protein
VPACLLQQRFLSAPDALAAEALLALVTAEADSLRATGAVADFERGAAYARSLQRITDLYARGLFSDSARFHRMLDHVRVVRELASGSVRSSGGRLWPSATPHLAWVDYGDLGPHFQPVSTVQAVAYLVPRPGVPTESLTAMGDQLYDYALWRTAQGRSFPVWEYLFPWSSGGVFQLPPWISGLAQAYAIILFTACHERTGDVRWLARARQVMHSLLVGWDEGGVLHPDTADGYWWEEYHPTVAVWNGAAQAVLALAQFARATPDEEVQRALERGIAALKHRTAHYDTGTWTRYSATQGYNTVAYHRGSVEILDHLYATTGDVWFKTVADRWRQYVPPPGVE